MATAIPEAQGESSKPEEGLANARARIQALAAGPANRLPSFQPAIAAGEDPRPGVKRNVPPVRVSTPWESERAESGKTLWLLVPEHAWTHVAATSEVRSLLFPGGDPEKLKAEWRDRPFRQGAPATWTARADGGIALESALSGGVSVSFHVLPGDRMFEVRFGVTNSSDAPLLETWSQFCSIFLEVDALSQQSPNTSWMLADGKIIDWGSDGQDLSWIEAYRDPATNRIARSCFFQAMVRGCKDERFPPQNYQSGNEMWLRRTLDAPILVKSSVDRHRHVAFYSPCGRSVLYNAYAPCCHVDPYMDGVRPGETRWVVVYGIFFEGELAALLEGLVEVDKVLRRTGGFLQE